MADKQENKFAYEELLQRYERKGYWSVYHAMKDDGYDPSVDYVSMLGILEIAKQEAKCHGGSDE